MIHMNKINAPLIVTMLIIKYYMNIRLKVYSFKSSGDNF